MSYKSPASDAYQQQQLTTASPVKVVALLYDKAIASLREAIEHTKTKDSQKRWSANYRAQEIILQLHSMLDLEKGGIIAENLDKLYATILVKLPNVDITNSPAAAEEAIKLLQPLRDAWHSLNEQIAAGKINPETEMRKAEADLQGQKPVTPATSGGYANQGQAKQAEEPLPQRTFVTSV